MRAGESPDRSTPQGCPTPPPEPAPLDSPPTLRVTGFRAGVPIKVVSQRIGQADPAVTMQVYAHALEGDDATAAETTATAIVGDG